MARMRRLSDGEFWKTDTQGTDQNHTADTQVTKEEAWNSCPHDALMQDEHVVSGKRGGPWIKQSRARPGVRARPLPSPQAEWTGLLVISFTETF